MRGRINHTYGGLMEKALQKTDLSSNLHKLDSFTNLKPGWDGHNAPSIPFGVIQKTRELISELSLQPELFPTTLKTIQLEYDNSQNDHMEIEISDADTAQLFIATSLGDEVVETIPSDIHSISERITKFYER